MSIENESDLRGILRVGRVVAEALRAARSAARPGVTTAELDHRIEKLLRTQGARPAPALCYNFPGAACISVNDAVAHGIPANQGTLREGDLVNVDVSAELGGYFADTGHSFVVGRDLHKRRRLCRAARLALLQAVHSARAGGRLNSIGGAIESTAHRYGYRVIRNLCSHGVGRALHEEPTEIPGYYDRTDRRVLREGQVITIEPFVSESAQWVTEDADGWTLRTPDGSLAAQHEFTLVITRGRPIVATPIFG